jgi:DNA topoisomerase-3
MASSVISNMTLIIAEKPSVARDIAKVVGAKDQCQGYLTGNGYAVTWAIGHLITIPEPSEIEPDWKSWKKSTLPMVPVNWPLKIIDPTKSQYELIKKLLHSAQSVICATDAGREGELIFRYIVEAAHYRKPYQRLWISSLTEDSIRKGLDHLSDAEKYLPLAQAARGRSRADWLVGMNYSRAYALATGEPFFVGRVQTPTLALVVARELEILNFRPENYFEVFAQFTEGGASDGRVLAEKLPSTTGPAFYSGSYCGTQSQLGEMKYFKAMRLPADGVLSQEVLSAVRAGAARVSSVQFKELSEPPPFFYDLTELQRHSNRLFGLSAARTLEVAQALYEKHKLISYPRTDSRYLSQSVAETLPRIVSVIRSPYEELLAPKTGAIPLGKRFINDEEVTDHHAIIPTETDPNHRSLDSDERKIYDLICRRLLAAWQENHLTSLTTILTGVNDQPAGVPAASSPEVYIFQTQGTTLLEKGWKRLEVRVYEESVSPTLPSWIQEGLAVAVQEVRAVEKKTIPPPHLTEATLLSAMENAGRKLEDRDLARAIRDCGIGTAATRASMIETLLGRKYILREGKSLRATEMGMRLIETVDESIKSPELTARWEKDLSLIQTQKKSLASFMTALEDELRTKIGEILKKDFRLPSPHSLMSVSETWAGVAGTDAHLSMASAAGSGELRESSPSNSPALSVTRSAPFDGNLTTLLKNQFGFDVFRPHQEAVCQAVIEGKDVLLVMPTGAGKSLCYQLPGLARGGTTLVISPLVALIEDQVAKLNQFGLVSDRIHSARGRGESRAACQEYLAGRLRFLFIAPERLAVPGFISMLGRRPLSLIAIDEAHCISHWGHDFRPNYRLLGERLKELRPAPVIALTATATPLVQEDIARQLGFQGEARFIQGFRRTNIAIQNWTANPSERFDAILAILKGAGRIPGIIYAPTRKSAEKLYADLRSHYRVEVYHAGMSPSARDRTQSLFIEGKLDLIVATVAFGMGIDKADIRTVIHAGLPGSVEGYYQEIGRAGRDGKPSLAVLLHSYADQRTHEFFFERDYPEVKILKAIYQALHEENRPKDWVYHQVRESIGQVDPDVFNKALEKLWIHLGAKVDPEENVAKGSPAWEKAYLEQFGHKQKQLQQMVAFTEQSQCRMRNLVRHFGDQYDSGENCGLCDFCCPEQAEQVGGRGSATLSLGEQKTVAALMASLAGQDNIAAGRLFTELTQTYFKLERKDFERILKCLSQAQWLNIHEASFQKGTETISYRKVSLSEIGRQATAKDLQQLKMVGSSYGSSSSSSAGSEKPAKKMKTTRLRKNRSKPATYAQGDSEAELSGAATLLFESLRSWRLEVARKRGIPAFRVLSDRVLKSISTERPRDPDAVRTVKGIGPKLADLYGREIVKIVNQG